MCWNSTNQHHEELVFCTFSTLGFRHWVCFMHAWLSNAAFLRTGGFISAPRTHQQGSCWPQPFTSPLHCLRLKNAVQDPNGKLFAEGWGPGHPSPAMKNARPASPAPLAGTHNPSLGAGLGHQQVPRPKSQHGVHAQPSPTQWAAL